MKAIPQSMNLETLLEKIAAISWFTNLGNASATDVNVSVVDLAQWSAFMSACTKAEFGLGHDEDDIESYPFSAIEWLPSSNDQPDPVHGNALAEFAASVKLEPEFLAAKVAGFKAACKSQRGVVDSPILRVGPTDSNIAALAAGRYACRMAAAEVALGQTGFWCRLVDIYSAGSWPMGLLPSGEVVVL